MTKHIQFVGLFKIVGFVYFKMIEAKLQKRNVDELLRFKQRTDSPVKRPIPQKLFRNICQNTVGLIMVFCQNLKIKLKL